MNAPSITRLLLLAAPPVAVLKMLFESPPVVDIVVIVTRLQVHVVVLRLSVTELLTPAPLSTVVDISLVCVDRRQLVGVILEYCVMTVGHDDTTVSTGREHVGAATARGEHVGVMVTTSGT